MLKLLVRLLGILITVSTSIAASALPISVTVTANPEWTSTGVILTAGESISITASGSWRHDTCCGAFYGPDGDPLISPPSTSAFLTTAGQHGALIGAIDAPGRDEAFFRNLPQNDSRFFLVGSNLTSFSAYASGMLYLGFNDWGLPGNEPAVSDNAGSVVAVISSASSVPLPSSLLLLILGMIILEVRRRRLPWVTTYGNGIQAI